MHVLALDGGSSSIKYALFEIDGSAEDELLRDSVEVNAADTSARKEAVDRIVARLSKRGIRPGAIGHRVVFGGAGHVHPERITDRTIEDLQRLAAFDPLHVPVALDTIQAVAGAFPGVPQVACYDTAFHANLPEVARRFALPHDLYPEIRRYGYHGLSYEYLVWKLGERARGRIVAAHLGNGASLAAIRDGRSIDTTMGLTPLGGMMMGTRSGDLDPGVLLRLLRSGRSVENVADLLTDGSGLLGVSGRTSDMRELLPRARDGDPLAKAAVDLFVFQARKWIGAMVAALDGLDRLVFTGGIGEHAPEIRALICRGLTHLGIRVDGERNAAGSNVISSRDSAVAVEVIATDENRMVARHAATLLADRRSTVPAE
jgi:acetate kinase